MQLVVRVIDKEAGKLATHTGRGDVIEIVEDDHEWGKLDLTNSSWVILRVPIDRIEADEMRFHEDPEGQTPGAHILVFRLDLEALIAKGYSGIPTKTEAAAARERYKARMVEHGMSHSEAKHHPANAFATDIVDVSAEDFRAAKVRRRTLDDRMVIG